MKNKDSSTYKRANVHIHHEARRLTCYASVTMSGILQIRLEFLQGPFAMTEIERIFDISESTFISKYLPKQVPLVISGCIEHWRARKIWNLDYFTNSFSDKVLRFSGSECSMGDFANALCSNQQPMPYLKEVKIDEQFPELLADIGDLRFTTRNLLNSWMLPRSMRIEGGNKALFIGGGGSGYGKLHWDYSYLHVYISQIFGEKDFIVYAPTDSPFLYPDPNYPNKSLIADFNSFNINEFPNVTRATPFRFTISEGDTLFIPAGWWHSTSMRGLSISVAESALDTTNFQRRGDWYLENYRIAKVPEWKLSVLRFYLSAINVRLG